MSDRPISELDPDPAAGPGATLTWQAEERGWDTFMDLLERAPAERVETPGYYQEGWSIKDVVAHIGTWLAEAGVAIERIRNGTYVASEIHIDTLNTQFLAAMRDVPFDIVRLQAWSARTMLRRQYFSLPPDPPAEATWWVRKSGPEHYHEHLPRLAEWVEELRAAP